MRINFIKPSKLNILGMFDVWCNFTESKWYVIVGAVLSVYLINFFFLGSISVIALSYISPGLIEFILGNVIAVEALVFAILSSRSYFQ